MRRRIFNGVVLNSALLFGMACSESPENGCPITIDTVEVIDQKVHEGKRYYLVRSITGWQEKTVVIQLFDEEPKFDRCRQAIVPPLIEDSIDPERSAVVLMIDLDKREFDITYAEKNRGGPGDAVFKISFKEDK